MSFTEGQPITLFQAKLLVTGAELQEDGTVWWHPMQMIDALKQRKLIRDVQPFEVYLALARSQRYGLVRACWGSHPDNQERSIRYFQVTKDGHEQIERFLLDLIQ